MPRFVDLSKLITEYPNEVPEMNVKIDHHSHEKGGRIIEELGLPAHFVPEGWEGWADDTITQMGVHSVTHIDAPWHYGPIGPDGKKAQTIDELPLDMFYGDGVVIDMSHKKDMELISKEDVVNFVKTHNLKIKEGTIVLIKTGRDKYMGTPEYFTDGTGMSAGATEWLIDQGVKVMGIDQWGWDRPLQKSADLAIAENDPELFWEAHRVGLRKQYCHMEQVVGLDQLPYDGFKLMAMPLPLEGCSGSPIRLVAMFED